MGGGSRLEASAEDVKRLVQHIGGKVKQNGQEIIFEFCPFCQGGKHRDKQTFSINGETGLYECKRVSCAERGNFYTLARHAGYTLPERKQKQQTRQEYAKMPPRAYLTIESACDKLEKRGIPREIVRKYRVITVDDSLGKKWLLFTHFDENGAPICGKYRDPDYKKGVTKTPKEKFVKGTKPVLYGMENCTGVGWLVLTEGQIDALSLAACGIDNPISVPNGAQGFTWCEHCREFVGKYSGVVVFGDNEQGKITLVNKLAENMPEVNIRVVDQGSYRGCKDANEILQKFGLEEARRIFKEAVDSAEPLEIPGVIAASNVDYVDLSERPRIPFVGLGRLAEAANGLFYGEVTVLAGASGKGKSTIAAQLVVDSVLMHGIKAAVLSAEMGAENTQRIIMRQMVGRMVQNGLSKEGRPQPLAVRYVRSLQENKLWYIEYDLSAMISGNDTQLDRLVKTVEQLAIRKGVRLVLVDNLMSILDVTTNDSLYQAQSRAAAVLANLARAYDLAVVLVAHTKKSNGVKEDDYDNINGSSMVVNLAGQVLMVSEVNSADIEKYAEWRKSSRCADPNMPESLPPDTVRRISVVKNRYGKEAKGFCGQYVKYMPDSMLCLSVNGGDLGVSYTMDEQERIGGGLCRVRQAGMVGASVPF